MALLDIPAIQYLLDETVESLLPTDFFNEVRRVKRLNGYTGRMDFNRLKSVIDYAFEKKILSRKTTWRELLQRVYAMKCDENKQ